MKMISVIVTTYNQPEMLSAVLSSLAEQSVKNFEVIVADDGSSLKTTELIHAWQNRNLINIQHVWQEDQGFRAAKIRNKAVAASCGDYLIFIDGDCVCRPDFIKRHQQLIEEGFFVAGNRILCTQKFSKTIMARPDIIKKSLWYWLWQRCCGRINRFSALFYLPFASLRSRKPNKWRGAKTCNLGLAASDFREVNGFDEQFEGWGYEDSDLVIRLLHAGVRRKSGRYATTVLHLWHPENNRAQEKKNLALLEQRLSSEIVTAKLGLNQY